MSGSEAKKPEADLAKRLEALELKMQTRDETYKQAIESVHGQNKTNTDRLGRIEQRMGLLEAVADRAAPPAVVTPATASAPEIARPPVAGAAAASARPGRLLEIASLLKDPEFRDLERIQTELRPSAAEATAFFLNEIKRTPGNVNFSTRVEELVRSFPAELVRGPLGRALEDPALRVLAAQIIAHVADPAFAELLHGFTTDPDPSFQVSVGVALVRCGDKAGVPFLIHGLRSDLKANRILSIQTLKSINRRQDYGYDWQKTPGENAGAVSQWERWWEAFKDYDLTP
jgi:hypothetical protein